jgi:hypothetical protein
MQPVFILKKKNLASAVIVYYFYLKFLCFHACHKLLAIYCAKL